MGNLFSYIFGDSVAETVATVQFVSIDLTSEANKQLTTVFTDFLQNNKLSYLKGSRLNKRFHITLVFCNNAVNVELAKQLYNEQLIDQECDVTIKGMYWSTELDAFAFEIEIPNKLTKIPDKFNHITMVYPAKKGPVFSNNLPDMYRQNSANYVKLEEFALAGKVTPHFKNKN